MKSKKLFFIMSLFIAIVLCLGLSNNSYAEQGKFIEVSTPDELKTALADDTYEVVILNTDIELTQENTPNEFTINVGEGEEHRNLDLQGHNLILGNNVHALLVYSADDRIFEVQDFGEGENRGRVIAYDNFVTVENGSYEHNSFIFNHIIYENNGTGQAVVYKRYDSDHNIHFTLDGVTFYYRNNSPLDQNTDFEIKDFMRVFPKDQNNPIGFVNDSMGWMLSDVLRPTDILRLNGEVWEDDRENTLARDIYFSQGAVNPCIEIEEKSYMVYYETFSEYTGHSLEPDRLHPGQNITDLQIYPRQYEVVGWYTDYNDANGPFDDAAFDEANRWTLGDDMIEYMDSLNTTEMTLYAKFVERTNYGVFVGGTEFTKDNTTINLGEGTATFDVDTATITLNNVTITGSHSWTVEYYNEQNEKTGEQEFEAAICSFMPYTYINLNGINTIAPTSNSANGVYVPEGRNLVIQGNGTKENSGTLNISGGRLGLSAGDFGVEGGNIDIRDGATVNITNTNDSGIFVNNNLNIINNATLTIDRSGITEGEDDQIGPGIFLATHGTLTVNGNSTISVINSTEAVFFSSDDVRFLITTGSSSAFTSLRSGQKVLYFGEPEKNCDISLQGGRLEINVPKGSKATNISDEDLHIGGEGIDYGIVNREALYETATADEGMQIIIEPEDPTMIVVTDPQFNAIPNDNNDDSEAINRALRKVRDNRVNGIIDNDTIVTVCVPAGQYILDSGLCIFSNTKFLLDKDAILKFRDGAETYALLTGCADDWADVGGYDRIRNIEIDGGGDGTSVGGAILDRNSSANELSCVLFLPHGNNIIIHGITVQNCTEHMINVSADKNVQIYDTMLKNQIAYTGNSETYWEGFENNATGRALRYFHAEAIHTDFTNPGNNECAPLDNTYCENIMVNHCYFENVLSGVGQHQEKNKIGNLRVKNVTVKNCQFKNILYGPAVNAYLFDNLIMDSNVVSYTNNPDHSGIGIYAKDSTGTITNNTITSKGDYEDHGIIHLADSNFTVSNKNDINTTSTYAIKVESGQAIISNNIIQNALRDGIRVNNTSQLTLYKNVISNITRYGIFVQGNRGNTNIESNTIRTNSSQLDNTAGILLENAPDNNIIKGNDITGDLKHDIQINTSNVSIIDNVLDTCKDNVLQLYNSNVTVQGNTIKNSAYHGIYVNGGPDSGKATIKSNVINNIAQTGIRAENIPLGVISGNKVSNVNVYGIYVSDTNQSITISENNVYGQGSAEKDWSASIYTKNCSSALIENNIATFGKESGIYIENSQGTIRGNKSVVNEGNGLKTRGTEENNTTLTINNNELGTKSQNKDKYALILDQYSKNCQLSCNALVSKGFYAIKDGTVSYNKNTTFTGLAMAGGTWYYFENGDLSNKTTLAQYNGSWFCVRNGQIDWNYTGLVEYNKNWFYVQNGQVNWNANNMLVDYEGRWYYIKGGIVDWSYTGLCQYNGRWYYIKGGMINWTEETLVSYNNIWFKVKGGLVDWNYTGLCQYNGNWFYVKGGMINWNYTGLCQYNGNWFYVKGGMINWTEETLVSYNNIWFKVKGGLVDWNYIGLFNYKGTLFYIKGGTINWNYNGTATYNGKQYNVKGGIAQ